VEKELLLCFRRGFYLHCLGGTGGLLGILSLFLNLDAFLFFLLRLESCRNSIALGILGLAFIRILEILIEELRIIGEGLRLFIESLEQESCRGVDG
jgi:hypothetical protein